MRLRFEHPLHSALIMFSLLGLLFSCSDDPGIEKTSLEGKWQLRAVLMDPGDGSGTFQNIQSDKVVEFFKNGNVKSNGNLCSGGGNASGPSSGMIVLPDSILSINDCPRPIGPTYFSLESGKLILSYPCIEPCQEKYVKID